MSAPLRGSNGFTLIDLLVSLVIAAILITGTVRLTLAATGSYRLQQDLSALQENARFALQMIGREATQAGYRPDPWLAEGSGPAVSPGSLDGATARGDRIAFSRRSNHNCYANENPATDGDGLPQYFLMETEFLVTDAGSLAQTCRYGVDAASLVTQINRLGLVQNVESMQALFAEDIDGDGNADRWVKAAEWLSESSVLGVKLAILLASPGQFGLDARGDIEVLDETVATADDGRLREVFSTVYAISGRSG